MARYGLSVLKRCPFRGGIQHFSNTYYYEGALPNTASVDLEGLADKVVAIEKANHGNQTTFVQVRLWSADGTPAENEMIVDKPLTGTGAKTPFTAQDRERAYLIQFRAGVDSRGRPVYLRKWFHFMAAAFGTGTLTNDNMSQITPLSAEMQAGLVAIGEQLAEISQNSIPMQLVAKSGRQISGDITAHPWYEHRQLGDEWRG